MSTICCPVGTVWIDAVGYYNDPSPEIGSGYASNITIDPTIANTCSILTNIGGGFAYAIPIPNGPIDCLCCPVGYKYSSFISKCIPSKSSLPPIVPPVPCVVCVCSTPVEYTCATCGTEGQVIAFNFDFTTRQCTDCTPQDNNGPGCIASFVPPQYVDPLINFKLRNKNFI